MIKNYKKGLLLILSLIVVCMIGNGLGVEAAENNIEKSAGYTDSEKFDEVKLDKKLVNRNELLKKGIIQCNDSFGLDHLTRNSIDGNIIDTQISEETNETNYEAAINHFDRSSMYLLIYKQIESNNKKLNNMEVSKLQIKLLIN